jgi:hypothetical protein
MKAITKFYHVNQKKNKEGKLEDKVFQGLNKLSKSFDKALRRKTRLSHPRLQ